MISPIGMYIRKKRRSHIYSFQEAISTILLFQMASARCSHTRFKASLLHPALFWLFNLRENTVTMKRLVCSLWHCSSVSHGPLCKFQGFITSFSPQKKNRKERSKREGRAMGGMAEAVGYSWDKNNPLRLPYTNIKVCFASSTHHSSKDSKVVCYAQKQGHRCFMPL